MERLQPRCLAEAEPLEHCQRFDLTREVWKE
jgi:hypothetical protein